MTLKLSAPERGKSWKTAVVARTLHFKEPAGTSRGVYRERQAWYVAVRDSQGRVGVGECAPLPDLSCDAGPELPARLTEACRRFEQTGSPDSAAAPDCPSVLFALETALAHAEAGTVRFWETPFSRGETGIPINGLVWMGSREEMARRLDAKLEAGFGCIKIKIGAIGFEDEIALLRHIRSLYPSPDDLELRLDANGAFTPDNALERLERLAEFLPHSLEQPLRQGQWEEMARICRESPIPIALDEELIGIGDDAEKAALLDAVHPRYLVLKPSLHGGLRGADGWARLAKTRGIGFWITSALESNVGLNAIAQWCAVKLPEMPQGLGTGQLFTDNCEGFPIRLEGSEMRCDPEGPEPDILGWLGIAVDD